MAPAASRRRFTIDEYHRMGEAGILADDPRIELIAGTIVVREPTGAQHAGAVDRMAHVFFSRLAGRAIVRIQNPVAFPDKIRRWRSPTSHSSSTTCSADRRAARGLSA